MEAKIIKEDDLFDKALDVDQGNKLFYIKLVGIGPNALSEHANAPVQVVQGQPGFFLISDPNEIRQTLHEIVDRACNAAELP